MTDINVEVLAYGHQRTDVRANAAWRRACVGCNLRAAAGLRHSRRPFSENRQPPAGPLSNTRLHPFAPIGTDWHHLAPIYTFFLKKLFSHKWTRMKHGYRGAKRRRCRRSALLPQSKTLTRSPTMNSQQSHEIT